MLLENERFFYFIEAREQNPATVDGVLPKEIIDTNLSTPENTPACTEQNYLE